MCIILRYAGNAKMTFPILEKLTFRWESHIWKYIIKCGQCEYSWDQEKNNKTEARSEVKLLRWAQLHLKHASGRVTGWPHILGWGSWTQSFSSPEPETVLKPRNEAIRFFFREINWLIIWQVVCKREVHSVSRNIYKEVITLVWVSEGLALSPGNNSGHGTRYRFDRCLGCSIHRNNWIHGVQPVMTWDVKQGPMDALWYC